MQQQFYGSFRDNIFFGITGLQLFRRKCANNAAFLAALLEGLPQLF